jgi:hypothetical protein
MCKLNTFDRNTMGAIVQLNSAAQLQSLQTQLTLTLTQTLTLTLTQTSKYISHAFRNKKHEYYL